MMPRTATQHGQRQQELAGPGARLPWPWRVRCLLLGKSSRCGSESNPLFPEMQMPAQCRPGGRRYVVSTQGKPVIWVGRARRGMRIRESDLVLREVWTAIGREAAMAATTLVCSRRTKRGRGRPPGQGLNPPQNATGRMGERCFCRASASVRYFHA